MEQLLSDVKILDLPRYIAGPYCTKLLADYGADVIKVEKPSEGKVARRMGPFFGNVPHPENSGLFFIQTLISGGLLWVIDHLMTGMIKFHSVSFRAGTSFQIM